MAANVTAAAVAKCTITSNPDVAGIGVRISTYAITGLAILLDTLGDAELQAWFRRVIFHNKIGAARLREDYKELHDSFRTALGISGITMILTAVIQSGLKALSLYHAICLMFYILLIFVPFFFGCLRSPGKKGTMLIYIIASLACEGWMLYFVLNAETFGGQCNAEVWAATAQFDGRGINRNGLLGVTITLMVFSAASLGYVVFPRRTRSKWRKHWLRILADRTLLVLIWCFWIYFTVWLEQIIAKAKYVTAGEKDWTYGQMLAIATLLGPLFEFCSLIRKWYRDPGEPVEEDQREEERVAVEQAQELDEELGRAGGSAEVDVEKGHHVQTEVKRESTISE
ncbi:hypothetical protein FN846DRAFT_609590 [Sphaerosporella brunnea]|uniref:Uncharacterized protein n=1 Tax=Sphaerosporella brunnea TaxID=1250544 RepID=A0A5J5EC72_9PEZI|nr:hypothetical protein FN846DRAFT_609590 [Sphaerosporella brunnea]